MGAQGYPDPADTPETPEADLAEQSADLADEESSGAPDGIGADLLEADPADAAEQAVAVPVDEDEYR
jgi:hypothetical protein